MDKSKDRYPDAYSISLKGSIEVNHNIFVPLDKVSNLIADKKRAGESEDFDFIVNLSKSNAKHKIRINFELLDYAERPLTNPLTYEQKVILFAVYGLIHEGTVTFTLSQIYRKIRGNRSVKPKPAELDHISVILNELANIKARISYDSKTQDILNKSKWSGIVSGTDNLLSFTTYEGFMKNTKRTKIYRLKFTPILGYEDYYTLKPLFLIYIQQIGQYTFMPDSYYDIKKLDAHKHLKRVQLDSDRAILVSYLIERINRCIRSNKRSSNKLPYETIWGDLSIKIDSRMKEKRYKEFTHYCLDHFCREGFIKKWYVYKDSASKPRGIEFYYDNKKE